MTAHPSYADLPTTPDGKTKWAWGVFGADDEVGTINWLTPDRIVASTSEVVTGRTISLNLPVTEPDPAPTGGSTLRSTPTRTVETLLDGRALDDRLDGFWLQGSTQWDGLAHIRHRDFGFYNGVPSEDVGAHPGARLGIEHWNDRIVGRGVLLDVARFQQESGKPFAWNEPFPIGRAVIEDVCAAQSIVLRPGDILMLRTGWLNGYLSCDREQRLRTATSSPVVSPGLQPSDELIAFLWDKQIAAIAADNPALEVLPSQGTPFGHWRLIPLFGFAIGELWWLEDLAADCAVDGRYTCMLVSVPLNVPGGIGSPANAIAIK